MKKIIFTIIITFGFANIAQADIVFFVNDQTGFNNATNSLTFLGIEDFESSTLTSGQVLGVDDPLAPGVPNGPLPMGTNPAIGLTIQSNTLAGNATTTSPFGVIGLATYADGFGSSPTDQLTTQFMTHSLDLLFEPGTEAVEFLPLFVDGSGNPLLTGPIEIEVYDSTNTFLDSILVSDVSFFLTDKTVGIVATNGMDIGRINLYDGNSVQHWQGVDEISVFRSQAVPEPGSAVVAMVLLSWFGSRRRRNGTG